MKVEHLLKQNLNEKKIKWSNNPKIGWLLESDTIRLYYGTNIKNLKRIFKEGIFASNDGYILCAAEPHTALSHATMRTIFTESNNSFSVSDKNKAVIIIEFPRKYLSRKHLFVENDKSNRFDNKELYEDWGKSDVEYYALIDVKVPEFIPTKFIKGYMLKNDS